MFQDNARSLANSDIDFCLGIFADDSVRKKVHECLAETGRWEERRRLLPAVVVVWLTLMLVLFRNVSIPNVFLRLRMAAERRWPRSPVSSDVPNDALCHARARLGFEPLMNLFGKTAEEVCSEISFAGLGAWIIDGTTCDMPDTEANEANFGRPDTSRGRAAFPQLKMVLLACAATRRIKAVRILPCRESEVTALFALLSHIPKGDVLFVDRGLAGYPLVHECQQRGIHLVMRINSGYKPMKSTQLGLGDYAVKGTFTTPAPELTGRRKTRDIKVSARMIVFRFQGHEAPVRLITTLPLELASAPALAEGYHIRWEVELGIDELKTHLSTVCHGALHTTFRSKSPTLVLQEVFALLTVYNLIRSTMAEAAAEHDLDPLNISFVRTLEVLRVAIPYFLLSAPADWPSLRSNLLVAIAEGTLKRPRRPKVYPRKVKQKISNFKLKRQGDKGRHCDFKEAIQLEDAA